jgi:hypothetical protein
MPIYTYIYIGVGGSVHIIPHSLHLTNMVCLYYIFQGYHLNINQALVIARKIFIIIRM